MKTIRIDRSLSIRDQVRWLVERYPFSYMNLLRFNKCVRPLADDILAEVPKLKSEDYNWATRCYWILHGLTDFPRCENTACGKPILRNVYSLKSGYSQSELERIHCCPDCARTDESTMELKRKRCTEKYGVSWYSKTDQYKEKCSKTRGMHLKEDPSYYEKSCEKAMASKLDRYGCLWTDEMTRKSKETRYINNGTAVYHTVELPDGTIVVEINGEYFSDKQMADRRRTCFEKYGVDYYMQTEEFQEKSKNSCLSLYGVEYSFQSENNKEKSKQTNLRTYGHEHAFAFGTEEFAENLHSKYGDRTYNNSEQTQRTCLDRYGNACYLASDAFLSGLNLDEHYRDIAKKAIQTKIRNNSFTRSVPEDIIYKGLCEKFGLVDVVRQYRSEQYPYHCDFYLKSLDLYIEFNGTWMHGGKFFDEADTNDAAKLRKWKDAAEKKRQEQPEKKSAYDLAVYTWTQLDPAKASAAISNSLRYLVFWNLSDAEEWLSCADPEKMRAVCAK